MRGYLIVSEDRVRYFAESNSPTLRHFDTETSIIGDKIKDAVKGLEPGIYRASDTSQKIGKGRKGWVLSVGKKVKNLYNEIEKLYYKGSKAAYKHHGEGRPGVAGYMEAMRMVEQQAANRKIGSKLLAEELRKLLPY